MGSRRLTPSGMRWATPPHDSPAARKAFLVLGRAVLAVSHTVMGGWMGRGEAVARIVTDAEPRLGEILSYAMRCLVEPPVLQSAA